MKVIKTNQFSKVILTALIIWSGTSGKLFSASSTQEKEVMVNRRVLILDFINVQNSTNYAYLEDSLPEAFLDPLAKTKSFELLSRTIWGKYVSQQKFKKEDAFREETAIEAGKEAGADVIVIGRYVTLGDHIQFFAKAIEVSSSRVIVARNSTAPLDNNLFGAITVIVKDMSQEMKEKLPPLPQRVILEERTKYISEPTDLKKQAILEAAADKWRSQDKIQSQKWREMEQVQAQKWRDYEAANGYKASEAKLIAAYWQQPPAFRAFGNIFIGTIFGAAMGAGSGMGLGWSNNKPVILNFAISSGAGALLGLTTGILVTAYDNAHDNSIIGDKLLINTLCWWGFGGLFGAGVGYGLGYVLNPYYKTGYILTGISTGSIVGLGIGLLLTFLPGVSVAPKETLKNLILETNPLKSQIGYIFRF